MEQTTTFSANAMLAQSLDRYKAQVQAANIDLYFAEQSLKQMPEQDAAKRLDYYMSCCLSLAGLAEKNGDDQRFLWALRQGHQRVLDEMKSHRHSSELRQFCVALSRKSLCGLCAFYGRLEGGKQLIETLKFEYQLACEEGKGRPL